MIEYLTKMDFNLTENHFHDNGDIANEKYKILFENSPEAIVLMEKNGDIADMNGKVYEWLGYKREQIIGLNFRKLPFIPYKSKIKIATNLLRRLSGEKIPPYELEFKDIRGRIKTGKISVSTIKNNKSRITQIMVSISDISRSKEIERELQEQQNQLKAIFSVSTDIMILMDRKYRYKAVNPAFCKYLNMSESELLGKTDFDIYSKNEAERYRLSDMAVIASGKKWEEDCQAMDSKGNNKWFQVIKAPVFSNSKTISGILISIRDITTRKEAENQAMRQKDFLNKMFESSANGLLLVNSSKEIVRTNEKALQILGRKKEELSKHACEMFHCPELKEKCPALDSEEKIFSTECQVLNKNGRQISVLKSISKIENGNETFLLESIVDITERKQSEEKIRDLIDTLLEERSIFKKGPVTVFKWKNQPGWPVEKVSANVIDVLGYSVTDFTSGRINYKDIIYKEDLQRVTSEVENNCKNNNTNFSHSPYRVIRKDGKVIWLKDSTNIIKDNVGKTKFLYGYVFDITALKDAENKLQDHQKNLEAQILKRTIELKTANTRLSTAKNKAEESDKLKSSFLANMSHEIRTPMNIILGFAELLQDNNPEELQNEYIRNINNSGTHLLGLINDIIDISKLEAGLVNIRSSEMTIEDNLHNFHTQFEGDNKCKTGKIKLILDNKPGNMNSTIYTDPILFNQILINLLGNAIKFTDKGNVHFGYQKIKNDDQVHYEFYVKDTGIGISESNKKIIFNRFRQAEFKDKGVYGGTGLGLSICKANVDLLGGNIRVESKVGKGTTVYFSIPKNQIATKQKSF